MLSNAEIQEALDADQADFLALAERVRAVVDALVVRHDRDESPGPRVTVRWRPIPPWNEKE